MAELEKVQKALASAARDEASRRELAATIVEWINPNHLTTDLMSILLPTRSLNEGDLLVKKLRKPGIRVRKFVPGTIHLADEIAVTDRLNYAFDAHIVKTMANLWDLERGDIGTVQDMRREMTSALSDFYMNRVFTLLGSVWSETNTPDNYAETATLTKTVVDDAIKQINYRAGGVQAIVAVRNTLLPMVDWVGYSTYDSHKQFSDEILTETLRSGWFGQYKGVSNVIGLNQIWNDPEANEALLPEDLVLVIGKNVGEFVTFGQPRWKEYTDMVPTPPYFVLEMYQQWGMIIDNAEGIYVIKITG